MRVQRTPVRSSSLVVARGYGLKIYVERGHLVVHDGVGRERETRRYHRATREISRLIVIGHSGYVTLDAIRWLNDIGAALLQFDADGRLVIASAAAGPNLAALRRAQATAAAGPAGLQIARNLLTAKVAGQLALLKELPDVPMSTPTVKRCLSTIGNADRLDELLAAEAQAAAAYWDAWAGLPIPFPTRHVASLPFHWLTFGQRASLLTGNTRLATNPAGAILNYLYALLEAETIVACHAVGLDPGIGIFHTDRRDRASLALDIMEAARPAVDAYLLALLTQRILSPRDFRETRQGACRLHPRLTRQLADTCTAWRHEVAPVVERVTHVLGEHSEAAVPVLTPLTRDNLKAAWAARKPGRPQRPRPGPLMLPNGCRECGAELPSHRQAFCPACRERRWERDRERGRESASRVLAALRAEQRDPSHGGRAAARRGKKNAGHQRAIKRWSGPTPNPEIFTQNILPGLRHKTIGDLVHATGLSEHYCSLIRLGKRVPHARHWDALAELAS